MYRKAAYDRMLADEFTEYLETEGDWPARNQFRVISKRDAGGRTIARMEEFMSNLAEELGVKEKKISAVIFWRVQQQNFRMSGPE